MKTFVTILTGLALTFALAGTANAGLTSIGPGGGGSETNLYGYGGVLDGLYGWDNVTRISDFPLPGDQIWVDLDGSVTAKAKYAGYTHRLGYSVDEVGGTNVQWLNVTSVGTSDTFNLTGDTVFIWALHVNNTNQDQFSRESLNGDEDMMVTYRIDAFKDNSIPTVPTYAICWADIRGGDHDFQDLVVEVSNAAPIPAPGAILLGGIGVGLVGWLRRRRAL